MSDDRSEGAYEAPKAEEARHGRPPARDRGRYVLMGEVREDGA